MASRRPALPAVNPQRCTGCGRCVGVCPPKVLWLEAERDDGMGRKLAVLHNAPDCTGCAQCAVVCPFDAIRMQKATPLA